MIVDHRSHRGRGSLQPEPKNPYYYYYYYYYQLQYLLPPICRLFSVMYLKQVGRVAQSVQRLTKGWTVRDRIPVRTRFSARPDRSWGPPSLLKNGYWVFPGGKLRPGRAADHSPHSSAAVMEEQSYTSTYPLGHTGSLYLYLYYYYLLPHICRLFTVMCLKQTMFL